jgi:hypothetical protein
MFVCESTVRCVPFSEPVKSDYWLSPDFLLNLMKGTAIDHCLLHVSLLLWATKQPTIFFFFLFVVSQPRLCNIHLLHPIYIGPTGVCVCVESPSVSR